MSTIKALLIPFEDTDPVKVVDLAPGREPIYDLIAPDSRMMQFVRSAQFDLIGDEEGGPGMRNDAGERVNARAMQLLAWGEGVGIDAFASPLCGDFLAVGPVDGNGNSTNIPQRIIDFKFSWRSSRPTTEATR